LASSQAVTSAGTGIEACTGEGEAVGEGVEVAVGVRVGTGVGEGVVIAVSVGGDVGADVGGGVSGCVVGVELQADNSNTIAARTSRITFIVLPL